MAREDGMTKEQVPTPVLAGKCPNCREGGFFRWCDGPAPLAGVALSSRCAHEQEQAHPFFGCSKCGCMWGKMAINAKPRVALVAIDPGIDTAIAVWRKTTDVNPIATATFCAKKTPRERGWLSLARNVTVQLQEWLSDYELRGALGFIEEPAFFDTSSGHMVARRGDFCKLAMITGWEISIMTSFGITPRLVGIANWKGQLPKTLVKKRIQKVLGKAGVDLKLSEHAWDAIGIGLAARGMLGL